MRCFWRNGGWLTRQLRRTCQRRATCTSALVFRIHATAPLFRYCDAYRPGFRESSLPRAHRQSRSRLPITPAILDRLRTHWEATKHKERLGLWGVSALCFAGFFRLGELLPSSKAQAKERGRLLWGDITVDNARAPQMLRVHLRVSKCDQFGKGINIFVGKTDNQRCPVTATVHGVQGNAGRDGRLVLPPPREEPLAEAKVHS